MIDATRAITGLCLVLFIFIATVVRAEGDLSRSAWSNVATVPDPGITDPQLRRGKMVYEAMCITCHGEMPADADPAGMPSMTGTQALLSRYKGAVPAVLDQRTDLTPEVITAFVRNGSNVMAALRPTEISDDDLAAVGAWLARKK